MEGKTEADISRKFKTAAKRLVLLDYDGTLVDHTSMAHLAKLPDDTAAILRKLSKDPRTELFIITGRRREDIDRFLDHLDINIIAEHGALIKKDGKWDNKISTDNSWKMQIIPILYQVTANCPDSYVEEKIHSLTWHYRNMDNSPGYGCSRELIKKLEKVIGPLDLKILDGNKVVEVMKAGIGKGRAVHQLLEDEKYDFILSVGDDTTDEEMFAYLEHNPKASTVKVGQGSTFARYNLLNISEVASLLKIISECV
jgi:trehalose 6-phosphate synthase/phosphatase